MQPLTAVPIGFKQDQPTSVAVGEPLPLHYNLPEQGLAITFAHESNADPAQLLEFILGVRCRGSCGGQKTSRVQYFAPVRFVYHRGDGHFSTRPQRVVRRSVGCDDDDVTGK